MAEETKQTDVQETEVVEETKEEVKEVEETVNEIDDLQKQIKDLRKESAGYRTKKNEFEKELADLKDKLAKSLGLKEDDEKDGDKLSDELARLQDKYRQERLKNAFYRVAAKNEADADLTWAVLQSGGQIADIDVDSDDFEADLTKIVKTTVEGNPKLKNAYKPNTGANPPADQKKTAKDEYNEVLAEVRKNPNDQSLKQKLFILKSRLKE